MEFIPAIKSGFRNCFRFTGRASRSEFWWFYLFVALWVMASSFVGAILATGLLLMVSGDNGDLAGILFGGLIVLVFFVFALPLVSLAFRRLHDADKSAWLLLLYLVPFGNLILLVFFCLPGTEGSNPYGPNPLRPTDDIARTFE